jgi:hypothetical protein
VVLIVYEAPSPFTGGRVSAVSPLWLFSSWILWFFLATRSDFSSLERRPSRKARFPTRLETRTKESNSYASRRVFRD